MPLDLTYAALADPTLPDGPQKIALNLRASDVPFAHLPLTEFGGAAM